MVKNKSNAFISAIIYVHNEEFKIYNFLEILYKELYSNFDNYEIICVNDASSDNSITEIKRFSKTVATGIITILNMSFFQGIELSMHAGIDLSIGDFIYEFDSPSTIFPAEMIFALYEHSITGFDIVSATPINNRLITSKLFYFLYNKVSNTQFPLKTETFRILSRRAVNRAYSMSKTIPYRKAVYANCGLKIDTLEYQNQCHPKFTEKKVRNIQKGIAVDALILYSNIAYTFSGFLACIMMLITLLIGIYTVYIYLGKNPVAGWTTTMLFLAFSFFGLFAILTILIKYVSIILDLSFNKQKYVTESIEKLNH